MSNAVPNPKKPPPPKIIIKKKGHKKDTNIASE